MSQSSTSSSQENILTQKLQNFTENYSKVKSDASNSIANNRFTAVPEKRPKRKRLDPSRW